VLEQPSHHHPAQAVPAMAVIDGDAFDPPSVLLGAARKPLAQNRAESNQESLAVAADVQGVGILFTAPRIVVNVGAAAQQRLLEVTDVVTPNRADVEFTHRFVSRGTT
jgi:hypothetical protein